MKLDQCPDMLCQVGHACTPDTAGAPEDAIDGVALSRRGSMILLRSVSFG